MGFKRKIGKKLYWLIPKSPYPLKETIWWIIKQLTFNIPKLVIIIIFLLSLTTVAISISWIPLAIIFKIGLLFFIVSHFLFRYYHNLYWKKTKFKNRRGKPYIKYIEFYKDQKREESYDYIIGFVGDILPMNNYKLIPARKLIKFFNGVNLIVGNIEGVIIPRENPIYCNSNVVKFVNDFYEKNPNLSSTPKGSNRKRLRLEILNFLGKISKGDKSKWLLSVSNNHSGDFQEKRFDCMIGILELSNFNYFGTCQNPSFTVKSTRSYKINIRTGTMWSNVKRFPYITRFNRVGENCWMKADNDSFNILYPHWHYENEPNIRRSFRYKSKNLIKYGKYLSTTPAKKLFKEYLSIPWDIVFGHHSHIPQHVEKYKRRFLFYSGGNFTSGEKRKKHRSGLIAKFYLKTKCNRLVIGKVEWSFTTNTNDKKRGCRVVKLDSDKNKRRKPSLKDVLW